MKESDLSRLIQIELAGEGVRLWRFPVGAYELAKGGMLKVGAPGMSDLLGLTQVIVTPAMVGHRIALFTAIEVKTPGGHTDPVRLKTQQNFIQRVRDAGGLAGFARSVEQARAITIISG